MNAPAKIVASLDWEKINGIRIKMACVTCGTDGAPAPFEPCHYVRKDIADELLEALESAFEFIADQYGCATAQALHGEFVSAEARPVWNTICAAIAKAKGESK